MNFKSTVFAGILLAVTMATARRVSLDEKTMQAAGEADEPFEAMREAASLVKKIMRAANEADEPGEAKRAKRARSCVEYQPCNDADECCGGSCYHVNKEIKRCWNVGMEREAASLVKKIMRAADEADEPGEAKRAKRATCKDHFEPCNEADECCGGSCYHAPGEEIKRCWNVGMERE